MTQLPQSQVESSKDGQVDHIGPEQKEPAASAATEAPESEHLVKDEDVADENVPEFSPHRFLTS